MGKEKKDKKEKITISKVASMSNVSKTTVSRFINNRQDMMSDAVARRIQEVIDETGFRPNRMAQNLKLRHTGIIGCVIADITSYFSANLVKGISDFCSQNNYQVLFVNTNNDLQKERETVNSLLDSRVDGLIVNTTGGNDDFLVDIKNHGCPIVIADRYLDKDNLIDTISSTNYKSTYECINYLVDQGYEEVYFFHYRLGSNRTREIRYQSYLDAIQHFLDEDGRGFVATVDQNDIDSLSKILMKISKSEKKSAIFAVNGMITQDIVEASQACDLRIGIDFGLCGFDDWKWMKLIKPGITAIRQDTYQTGVESAKHLFALIDDTTNSEPLLIELPTKLIKRGSTEIK